MADTKRKLGDAGWIEFKASGYPFGLRRKLQDATDDAAVIEIIKSHIVSASIPTLDGQTLDVIRSVEDLANVEERLVAEIIFQFYEFRGERNREPLPKGT